ncbi:DUF3900 domain-containing protein [Xylanibacillus composti]|uniref:DUF3898 domain-containing protein n=1 Tax=Xylanibacillus composti TaxID=1572762 RepID=A0A8J4H372_9BACL|nr:DUF3900 domain-containing protein [Xylanibacillus composti]MDT9726040.1 DUF3900 domain-containing protein [Xylanibacillus composti]GIQ68815.1 hypothetical protein XYCOK13_16390 [Xylanibacillus composti]
MDLSVQYLSFFVIQTEGFDQDSSKTYKHYKTLNRDQYEDSELKEFLDGEFVRIVKRKAELHPSSDNVPTKIGRFIVEPGHEWTSNPNYNLFQRLRMAYSLEAFAEAADELVRMYMDTAAVRGGALIAASVKLQPYFDEPFVFVLKCDFESKIARISDENSLISHVDRAISARNLKWILYPHMPEEGMLEEGELKIHQASHARYFEDFLRFVTYEKPIPEVVSDHVLDMVHHYMEDKWQGHEPDHEGRQQEEQSLEFWAAGEKRELQEKWQHEQVMEAAARLIEVKPELDMKFKLDGVTVRGKLTDYGSRIHLGRMNGKYVVLIEGESFEFEKGISPIELLHPDELEAVLERMRNNAARAAAEAAHEGEVAAAAAQETHIESAAGEPANAGNSTGYADDDAPPWD